MITHDDVLYNSVDSIYSRNGDVNLRSNLVIQSFSTGWGYDASYDASYDATMTALMTYFGGNPPR
jgi:hypothetical protein